MTRILRFAVDWLLAMIRREEVVERMKPRRIHVYYDTDPTVSCTRCGGVMRFGDTRCPRCGT